MHLRAFLPGQLGEEASDYSSTRLAPVDTPGRVVQDLLQFAEAGAEGILFGEAGRATQDLYGTGLSGRSRGHLTLICPRCKAQLNEVYRKGKGFSLAQGVP